MRLSHIFVSLAPFALTAHGLPVSGSLSDTSDDNRRHSNDAAPTNLLPGNAETNWGLRGEWNQNLKVPKFQSSELPSEGPKRSLTENTTDEHRLIDSLLPGPDGQFDESTKPHSHRRENSEDESTEAEASLENATGIEPQTFKADASEDNATQSDTSVQSEHSEPTSEIERRGSEKVDRRQKDPNKPIDFSLLTPCLGNCFWKFNHVAPKKLDKVTMKEWCDDKLARWRWWLDFGPLHCFRECAKKDRNEATISREWFLANCGGRSTQWF